MPYSSAPCARANAIRCTDNIANWKVQPSGPFRFELPTSGAMSLQSRGLLRCGVAKREVASRRVNAQFLILGNVASGYRHADQAADVRRVLYLCDDPRGLASLAVNIAAIRAAPFLVLIASSAEQRAVKPAFMHSIVAVESHFTPRRHR